MLIGSRQNISFSESIQIYVDNELIREVKNQKLLGITIDKHLTWNQQIDIVSLNITRRITLLKLLSKYVGKQSLNQYYNSYILPIIDFGCMIWGRCSDAHTNRLLKLQKRAARIILQADILTPSKSMFKELRWLSFLKRIKYHTYIMMYKTLTDMAPEYMSGLFKKSMKHMAEIYDLLITILICLKSHFLIHVIAIDHSPFRVQKNRTRFL